MSPAGNSGRGRARMHGRRLADDRLFATRYDFLLILGAVARAAAFSALAAGLRPTCGDLFADADLARRCPVTAVTNYPRGMADLAEQGTAPAPWMYTGDARIILPW